MVHIQDLPVEILNRVFYFVYPHRRSPSFLNEKGVFSNVEVIKQEVENDIIDDDDETANENLFQLCLVSRTFREIAQPLLFHTFSDDNVVHGDLRKTISFAKTIYRRPELGKYVKDIAFLQVPIHPKPKRLAADDAKLCKRAIKALELGDQEEKRWISSMRSYDFAVLISLVVLKTPNIRGFSMAGDIDVAGRSSLEIHRFKLEDYDDFITRPSLKHLTLEYCELDEASFPSNWTPGSLAAETLMFRSSRIDGGAIRKLMQACKKLTMFGYQNFDLWSWFIPDETPVTANHFTAAQVTEAALLHNDTLKHFHVEFARSRSDLEDMQEYLSSRVKFGSFREFSALENIMVSHAYIPVHPELPCSLKQLTITDCNSSIQSLAQNIAKDTGKGLHPKLRGIRVLTKDIRDPIKLPGGRIPANKTPADVFLELQDLFIGTNVLFNICPYVVEDMLVDDEDSDLGYDDEFPPGLLEAISGPPEVMDQMPPELLRMLMQEAMRDPDFAHFGGPPGGTRGPPEAAQGPSVGPPGRNEMPPGLLDLLMEQAMRDPDFAHLRPPGR